MIVDYKDWETNCNRVRKDNAKLLSEFKQWLDKKGLGDKIIDKHISNIDFYVNEYLLHSNLIEAKDGAIKVCDFFGDWFIRKAMWASKTSVKSIATSLRKFYNFMYEKNLVEEFDIEYLSDMVKEEMPVWLKKLERFDNLDEDW